MIDMENEIFTGLATLLRAAFTGIYVTGEASIAPESFPAVYIEEADNATYEKTLSSHVGENHATLMYEINVYSNKIIGKKSEAKAIMAVIDTEMQRTGFSRLSNLPTPNLGDTSIHRRTARYTAVADADHNTFRR